MSDLELRKLRTHCEQLARKNELLEKDNQELRIASGQWINDRRGLCASIHAITRDGRHLQEMLNAARASTEKYKREARVQSAEKDALLAYMRAAGFSREAVTGMIGIMESARAVVLKEQA